MLRQHGVGQDLLQLPSLLRVPEPLHQGLVLGTAASPESSSFSLVISVSSSWMEVWHRSTSFLISRTLIESMQMLSMLCASSNTTTLFLASSLDTTCCGVNLVKEW